MLNFTPTNDQQRAIDEFERFQIDIDRRSMVINGPAGSGKSSLLNMIRDQLGNKCVVCAPTNKAVNVLRRKGFNKATTLDKVLHKSIYSPVVRDMTPAELGFYESNGLEIPNPPIVTEDAYEKLDATAEGTIVCCDESSMTNVDQFERLVAMYPKVVWIGDGFQLPPVEGIPWFQDCTADVTLNEIVRTAAESEITQCANLIRNRNPEWKKRAWSKEVEIIPHKSNDIEAAIKDADVVLAFTNRTCDLYNSMLRELRGVTNPTDFYMPAIGEPLLAWDADKERNIIRSELYEVLKVFPLPAGYRVRFKGRGLDDYIDISKATLMQQNTNIVVQKMMRFSFGHCITGHKCVAPDTLVETQHGLQMIKDIPPLGLIATPSGPQSYGDKFTRAVAKMLRITTSNGYTLRTTTEHGMTSWDGERHIRIEAQNLKIGNWLRLKLDETIEPPTCQLPLACCGDVRETPWHVPTHMTGDFAEFLGLFVGDGTLCHRGFRLLKRHQEAADRFAVLCNSLFNTSQATRQIMGYPGFEVSSTFLARWLAQIPELHPNCKAIPALVLQSSIGFQQRFLRGLFEDGSVLLDRQHVSYIEWSTCMESMARTVHTMLLRMGIIATLKQYRDQYRISIYSHSATIFASKIGFISEFKQNRLNQLLQSDHRSNLPVSLEEIASIRNYISLSSYHNARLHGYLSRQTAYDALSQNPNLPWLADRIGWHYVTIKNITETEGESICVSVPNGTRFLQNGFDGWNSQGGEHPHVVVLAFDKSPKYDDYWHWLYTACTRAKEKLTIIV